jgi:alcohol dehydrogenase class IV
MQFEFATATRIVFGPGTFSQAAPTAAGLGHSALVVTTPAGVPADALLVALQAVGVSTVQFPTDGEPTMDQARLATRIARDAGVDVVLALGGGSVIDTAKAVAALLANGGEPEDYAEVIGRGLAITKPSVPWIAIPTTAGTGAEVTRNTVLAAPEQHVKVSIRSPLMLARVAIVDPELTYGLPKHVTAHSGLDALTQVLEPFVSVRANPLVDSLCREALPRAARSLQRAYEHGDDRDARLDMSLVSLFGGMALANAGLGAAHAFAAPIGGAFPAPHGAICAAVLPYTIEVNVRALKERDPANPAVARYDEVGRMLTGDPNATGADGARWVLELQRALDVPPLREWGLGEADVPEQVDRALASSSMKGNPLPLTTDEMTEILRAAL